MANAFQQLNYNMTLIDHNRKIKIEVGTRTLQKPFKSEATRSAIETVSLTT